MRFAAAAVALFLIAAPSSAQDTTTAANASPGAIGLELINTSNATGVFTLLPAERIIALRHAQSGMICRFDPEAANRLMLFPDAPRGDDVACETGDVNETVVLHATRYPSATTNAQQADLASAALLERFPGAQRWAPARVARRSAAPALPPHITRRYAVTLPDGRRAYARVAVAVLDEWTLKLRYTAAAPDAAAMAGAESTAAAVWRSALNDFTQSRAARERGSR